MIDQTHKTKDLTTQTWEIHVLRPGKLFLHC